MAPIVVVPKGPNADKVRICVDYTQQNNGVKRETYPVAEVEVTLANMGGGSYSQSSTQTLVFFKYLWVEILSS